MSHIQQQRDIFKANRQKVMNLLKWDELKYAEFQEQKGIEYLRYGMEQDEYWLNALIRRAEFWKFWINQWNLIDEYVFLKKAAEHNHPDDMHAYYAYVHGYRKVESFPSKDVFDKAYAEMIGNIFDTAKEEFVEQDKKQLA